MDFIFSENFIPFRHENHGLLALAQLILPSEILSNFEVVRVEEEASLIRIYLDESVKADYKENPLIESKRFCYAVTIRNFQGFWEKCRDDDKEKRRLSHFENRPILFFMIEKNYFLINSHFAFPYAQAYNLISYVPSASHSQFGPPSRESSLLKSPPQAIVHFLFALNLNCPTAN